MNNSLAGQPEAQERADRIRILRQEIDGAELRDVLALSEEQRSRFDTWSADKLRELAAEFDVDTTEGQKRISWGMRIASTLGGLAICAALVLFFARYWGRLDTPVQVIFLMLMPLLALAGTEYAARRERTLYFAGLMALVSLAAFILNLSALGDIFNITSTEKALLAWGAFALLLAYRYGLRLLLTIGLVLSVSYCAAALTTQMGYRWLDFGNRPEHLALLGLFVFAVPFLVHHRRQTRFPAVYRSVGALVFFAAVMALAEWGAHSYLALETKTVERSYELLGLLTSAGAIWLGITWKWNGIVNCGSIFFALFLYCRLYHWWWDWMPKYVFFAVIGAIAIALVAGFKRLRLGSVEAIRAGEHSV